MILLDTHIWFWWVQDLARLTPQHRLAIEANEGDALIVSAISCWEIALLVSRRRLMLDVPIRDWIALASAYPGVRMIPITPEIAVESVLLPGELHADPADRLLVATARALSCPILTVDERLLAYPHVEHVP